MFGNNLIYRKKLFGITVTRIIYGAFMLNATNPGRKKKIIKILFWIFERKKILFKFD